MNFDLDKVVFRPPLKHSRITRTFLNPTPSNNCIEQCKSSESVPRTTLIFLLKFYLGLQLM